MPLFRSTWDRMMRIETRRVGQYCDIGRTWTCGPERYRDEGGAPHCPWGWDNCDCRRQHYAVILPNLQPYWTNTRASNCRAPHDRLHRCWTAVGPMRHLSLLPSAHRACGNSAGSIVSYATSRLPAWHGYLRGGEFVAC